MQQDVVIFGKLTKLLDLLRWLKMQAENIFDKETVTSFCDKKANHEETIASITNKTDKGSAT